MTDNILYRGKLFQVISRSRRAKLTVDGREITKELTVELVRRPPGVRAIIRDGQKLLLNREFRYELNDWDYRLPGGKVFDRLEDFEKAIEENTIDENAYRKLAEEVREEADIEAEDYGLFEVSRCGLTVEWNLYYFTVDKFKILPSFYAKEKQKSEYEYIEHVWLDFAQIKQLILDGRIREDRSIAILFKYMMKADGRAKGEAQAGGVRQAEEE